MNRFKTPCQTNPRDWIIPKLEIGYTQDLPTRRSNKWNIFLFFYLILLKKKNREMMLSDDLKISKIEESSEMIENPMFELKK